MPPPLRIAMFVGTFPVISETFILRQITGLLELGHEVDIYADARAEPDAPVQPEVARHRLLERTTFMDMPPESAPWELPVRPFTGETWPPGSETAIPNSRRILQALPALRRCVLKSPRLTRQVLSSDEFGYQAESLSALYRLAKLSGRSRDYDVLHAHFGPVGNSFRFARELWRAPLVVSFHGYDFSTLPRQEGAGMYQKLFRSADAVTVNSDYTRAQVEKLGCPTEKLHKLPVGLDLNELTYRGRAHQAGEPLRILSIARLVPIKGHEFVLRALAKLREKHSDFHFDLVGDGPQREELKALVRELKLETAVSLHGALDSAALIPLMDRAHIFVLASVNVEGDQEGQGLALQEAQAAGLPVIATQHGALPEGLLPGESGYLVPERDADALAERFRFLATHPELWPKMGRKGREFVAARYDIRRLNQQLAELYETVKLQYETAKTRDV